MDRGEIFRLLITALPAAILGWLTYRRSRKNDKVAEQSGVATETRAGTAQIIEGLNDLIDNLQVDNREFRSANKEVREDIKTLTERLNAMAIERDELRRERDDLRREVTRLRRKYGEEDGVNPST